MHPDEGIRHVLDLHRVDCLGVKAVVCRHHADSLGNKPAGHFADLRLVATVQPAAMNPEQHRVACLSARQIDVQLVPALGGIVILPIDDVPNHRHPPGLGCNRFGGLSRRCLFFSRQLFGHPIHFPFVEKAVLVAVSMVKLELAKRLRRLPA